MNKYIWPIAVLLVLVGFAIGSVRAADDPPFLEPDDRRILFLGDSITQAGGYVDHIDACLFTRFPDRHYELINLGLSSETVSGLTEPDHPFPRPDLHDRLDRALEATEPHIVIACYGMNDGIYHPFGEERFAAYRAGVDRLIEKAQAAGAKVVLMTPPPFDPVPIRDRLVDEDAPEHGYKTPYRGYDNVLKRYAAWIMEQRDRVDRVVDLHTTLHDHLAARRAGDAEYTLAGDGIHPNGVGHRLIARELLDAWGLPADASPAAEADGEWMELVRRRQDLLAAAWRGHVGHKHPGQSDAPPLHEAKEQAAALERRIRESAPKK